jgi:hypothetical protein
MTNEEIVKIMTEWQMRVVEKPNPAFSGMPVCPFAKKARVDKKIRWEVVRFEVNEPLDRITALLSSFDPKVHDTMIIVNPEKSFGEDEFCEWLETKLRPLAQDMGLDMFGGHPDETWEIAGFKVGWPYPSLIAGTLEHFGSTSVKLMKSRYYDKFSQANLDYLGVPKKAKTQSSSSSSEPTA